jgi:SSS family solute:Na+ symporter
MGLGINNDFIFVAFWAFVIVYTMVGGLKAVVFTDVAQVWLIILVFGGIFGYALLGEPCSFFSLESCLAQQNVFKLADITSASLFATILLPILFSLIEQDLAQRFFAARTQRIATMSAIASSIFLLAFALIPIYFGMKAQLLGIEVLPGASPLIPVIQALTNDFVVMLAVCGIIAAITSTADSLLCAVSSNIAQDFDFSFLGLDPLTVSKIVTLVTGVVAFGAAYVVRPDIIDILISSYEISVSCLLVPLLYAYFGSNLKKSAAFCSIACGLIGFVIFRIYPIALPKEVAALVLSWLGYQLGKLESVDSVFARRVQ